MALCWQRPKVGQATNFSGLEVDKAAHARSDTHELAITSDLQRNDLHGYLPR